MDTSDIVWIVVAVLVLLALAALIAAMMRKKKSQQNQQRAQELRAEAAAKADHVAESRLEAQEAELRAERAKLDAERAEQRAAELRQGHTVEEARFEEQLREADRIDPNVDHKSDDYRPLPPTTGTSPTTGTTGTTGTTDTSQFPPSQGDGSTRA